MMLRGMVDLTSYDLTLKELTELGHDVLERCGCHGIVLPLVTGSNYLPVHVQVMLLDGGNP